MIKYQFSSLIKVFQLDGRGDFTKTDFIKRLETCGILHQLSCRGNTWIKCLYWEETSLHCGDRSYFVSWLYSYLLISGCLCYNSFLYKQMPITVLQNMSPFQNYLIKQPNYNLSKYLDVYDIRRWEQKPEINFNQRPVLMYLLVRVHKIKDIVGYILLLEEYTFCITLSLMNQNFLSLIRLMFQLLKHKLSKCQLSLMKMREVPSTSPNFQHASIPDS